MKFEEKLYKTKKAVTFDDVLIQPAYSEVSIADVDVTTHITKNIRIKVPVISSPMDTVTQSEMAKAMAKRGGVGVIHYNCSIEDQKKYVAAVKKENLLVGAAVGPHDDERVKVLLDKEVDFIVIDTAHGHRKSVIDAIKRYKKEGVEVIGGNIVSAKAAEDLIAAGADGLRVGVGPGSICFEAGALVLMEDYSVKPIEQVQAGDRVITHKGRARTVTKTYARPYKGELVQVKAGGSPLLISATPNHPFYAIVFDVDEKRMKKYGPKHFYSKKGGRELSWTPADELLLGSVVVTPRQDACRGVPAPVLDLVELVPGYSADEKSIWSEKRGFNPNSESHVDLAHRFLTTPRVIQSVVHGGQSRDTILGMHVNAWLDATHYEREIQSNKLNRHVSLGEPLMRLFGYYLAEGFIGGPENNKTLRFGFSKLETAYHEDVKEIIRDKFGYPNTSVHASKTRGGVSVIAYSHILARFFERLFGTGMQGKKIPAFFFDLDPRLLKGLLVGLIRGDGTVKEKGRVTYTTTSASLAFQVAELFSRLGFIAGIRRIPKAKPNWSDTFKVGISGKQVRAFAGAFPELGVRLAESNGKQQVWRDDQYVYFGIDEVSRVSKSATVYNLEVDEDESYVVNRIAVHNCTTRVITGIGVPQLTAVSEVADYASKYKVPVIADGGIKYSGDLAKAIAAGADCGMLGNALAGTDEAPGEIVNSGGAKFKRYRGMGSVDSLKANYAHRYDAFKKSLVPEGVSGLIKYKGSVDDVITQFEGGLKKAMVYVGAKNIEEFKKKAFFVRITQTGLKESHPHSLLEMEDTVNYSREE